MTCPVCRGTKGHWRVDLETKKRTWVNCLRCGGSGEVVK